MKKLNGNVVLVIGSDSGIRQASAIELAREGAADYITGASYVIDGGFMQNQGQGA